MSGQFVVFTIIGPLRTRLTHAPPNDVGLVFALYGVCGFVGIVIATRMDGWGAYRTLVLATARVLAGLTGVGGLRRQPPADGRLGRGLGFGIRLLQFDATGQACRG